MWDILGDGINIKVNGVGIVKDMKTLALAQKKIYRKHHRVRGILIEALPDSEYIKIIISLLLRLPLSLCVLLMKGTNKSKRPTFLYNIMSCS